MGAFIKKIKFRNIFRGIAIASVLIVTLSGCGINEKSDQEKTVEYSMVSISMENTILAGETVYVNKNAYENDIPERYDVVMFRNPDDVNEKNIGRLIGLPGETVVIKNGKVYIDDNEDQLDDSFCPEDAIGDFGPYKVPDDSYFILGDNRNCSKDSRFWNNTFVEKNDIYGKVKIE